MLHIVYVSAHYISPLIPAVAGLLSGPTPYWLIAVTMTTTVPVNTPLGNDGAVNVSVVVEQVALTTIPLYCT